MKKLLCLILCIVLASVTLVACSSDEEIGDGTKDYPRGDDTVNVLTLNMCIITGDSTTKSAGDSVATRISDYAYRNYKTYLNITYVTESEYDSYLDTALEKKDGSAPHIVLINSEAMFNELYSAKKLADLTDYYYSKDYEKDFGTLKTQISSALIDSSKVLEYSEDTKDSVSKLYTVPNNRVLGEYEYLVIDKEVAVKECKFSNTEIAGYKSLDDAAELMQVMTNRGYNASELVRIVKGPYEIRKELSATNICNIIKVPTVTKAEAFASAFAVIKNSDAEFNYRAMKMIFAINTDLQLRNYLQYGVSGANYIVNDDGDIVRLPDSENTYDMNLAYTGDVFKAAFCSELAWTKDAKDFGILQNADAVVD